MKTKYLSLTKEQKGRGVVFSSTLNNGIEHEITKEEFEKNVHKATEKMNRLKDVSFFKGWGGDIDGKAVHVIRE